MTDPVPYEPAENIPPLILPGTTPDPFRLYVVNPEESASIELSVEILEYNLDDTLYFQLIKDNCATGREEWRVSSPPPAIRERRRTFSRTLSLSASPLAGEDCVRLVLAVSDRGWSEDSPPYCGPRKDENGDDLTVVSLVQWWIQIDDGSTTAGPGVRTCGDTTSPPP